jgi:hypothetical protein
MNQLKEVLMPWSLLISPSSIIQDATSIKGSPPGSVGGISFPLTNSYVRLLQRYESQVLRY